MDGDFSEKNPDSSEVKVIAGFLASALDIEDTMSLKVYGDFLDRQSWPANLTEEAFQTIRNFLTTLIQDTEAHKKTFLELKNKLNNDASR